MATSFSANQYQNAFGPKKLQNWETPQEHKEMPRSSSGSTRVIANDKGHLLEGVPRSSTNPWGNFVGTWDLPKKIPGNKCLVTTARAPHAQDGLARQNTDAGMVMSGKVKNAQRSGVPDEITHSAKKDSHVTIMPDPERSGTSSKVYPKTHFPTPAEIEQYPIPNTPDRLDQVASPAGSRPPSIPPKGYLQSPMPDIAPQGRSPSPPVKSPCCPKPDVAAL